MITKQELADLCIINLSGGAPNSMQKYDRREFYKYIDMAVTSLINAEIKSRKKPGADGAWIKSYEDVVVKWDNNRKKCFFDLPCPVINIPNDEGLYSISPLVDESTQHVITKKGQFAVFKELDAADVGFGIYACYLEGNKVYYPDMPSTMIDCPLMVTLIPDPSGLKPNDPINVPGTLEKTMIDLILDLSKGQVTYHNKKSNDQNPNTP